MLKDYIERILMIAKRTAWIAGCLLLIFIITDLIDAYNTLTKMNTWLGYALIFVISGVIIWIVFLIIKSAINKPKIKYPPDIDENKQITNKQIRAYNKYLLERHGKLLPNVDDEIYVEKALRIQNDLCKANRDAANFIELINIKNRIETELFFLTNSYLKSKSDKIIENNVRDIMISVLASPYRSVDIFIVIVRNLKMYNQLIKLYNVRLGIRYNFRNLIDVLKIVVAVNYINMGEKFIEGVLSEVPFLKKFGGDLAQGIGAGILSNSFSQLAVTRLTILNKWNEEAEKMKFMKQIKSFSETVRNIAKSLKPSAFKKAEKNWSNFTSRVDIKNHETKRNKNEK